MFRAALSMSLGVAVLTLTIGSSFASNPRELRERAEAINREAAGLAERGHADEADKLRREARELLEAAERQEERARDEEAERAEHRERLSVRSRAAGEHREAELVAAQRRAEVQEQIRDAKRRQLERIIDELHTTLDRLRDGVGRLEKTDNADTKERVAKEIGAIEDRLARFMRAREELASQEHLPHREHAEREEGFRRIGQIRQAAKLLHEAGLHDIADELIRRAEDMERELRQRERREEEREAHPEPPQLREIHGAIDELRQAVKELRHEVAEIREQLERRSK